MTRRRRRTRLPSDMLSPFRLDRGEDPLPTPERNRRSGLDPGDLPPLNPAEDLRRDSDDPDFFEDPDG